MWSHRATDPRWVVALAAVLFVWNLWGYDLWAPDEPFFGEGAREMVVDGEWLVPHVNGEVNTHKPPVFFWLIALCSLPFGEVSAFTARLPSALAALGSLLLVVRLGRRMGNGQVAALAAAVLATTHLFLDKARSAQIDGLLCFLILAAVSAFEAFRAGDWPGRRAGVVFWVAAALAVLAKGPVGLLLPLGIALAVLAFDRDLGRFKSFAPLTGPLAFLAVAGLWVAATTLWADDYSVWGALQEHFVDRGIHGLHHAQPVWYYGKVLPYTLLPWSLLLPGALYYGWRHRRRADDRFLLVFGLFVVLFFTVSTEKRDLYILPAVPAFALLTARLVAAAAGRWQRSDEAGVEAPSQRWVTLPQGIVGALMVLAAVAAPIIAPRQGKELLAPALGLAVVFAIGGLGILVSAIRGRAWRSAAWTAGAMAAGLLLVVTFVNPALNPRKSGRELAVVVRDATAGSRAAGSRGAGSRVAGRPVLGLDLAEGAERDLGNVPKSLNFYSDGVYLKWVLSVEDLHAELSTPGTVFLLANEDKLPTLPAEIRERMHVVYSTRLSRRNLVFFRVDG